MERDVLKLYENLIEAWNNQEAEAFANVFSDEAICIGFDGSHMAGKANIESQLSAIFKDHRTAKYVTLVRECREVAKDVYLLRAHVGMIPPKHDKIDSAKNAVQIMMAKVSGEVLKIFLFQNTPAQFHGNPDAVKALSDELQKQYAKDGFIPAFSVAG